MTSKTPYVSIVVPTYNHADFLAEALDSVRRQTYHDWEAIVVNNFSEDDTEQVVASFADPRIRLENFRNHGIIAASRNVGIKMAKGDVIAFLDSDDVWYPKKLERCVSALEQSKADLVWHGERWVDANGRGRDVLYATKASVSYHSLLFQGNCISTSAVVVRRRRLLKVGGFSEDAEIVSAEDYDLWLNLAKIGARFIFLPEILGEYRRHEGGISQGQSESVLRNIRATLAVVERHLALLPMSKWGRKIRYGTAKAKAYFSGGLQLHEQGSHLDAIRLYARYLPILPWVVASHGFKRVIQRLRN